MAQYLLALTPVQRELLYRTVHKSFIILLHVAEPEPIIALLQKILDAPKSLLMSEIHAIEDEITKQVGQRFRLANNLRWVRNNRTSVQDVELHEKLWRAQSIPK